MPLLLGQESSFPQESSVMLPELLAQLRRPAQLFTSMCPLLSEHENAPPQLASPPVTPMCPLLSEHEESPAQLPAIVPPTSPMYPMLSEHEILP